MGDERLSDEAIHIAAGMLFAGYGGVIGTMWPISDEVAPDVARDTVGEDGVRVGSPIRCLGSSTPSFDHLREEFDIGIRDKDNRYLLLIKKAIGRKNPEPRLIAEAIAAYQNNNVIRETKLHLPILDEITFPGITYVGTAPTFYKIKVTTA
ncbi:hypothetical protein OG21DRAFT_1489016 [Imleria badia]|nr:hypothetical protein OG21DRAFT_1489016 [Imleria badia]